MEFEINVRKYFTSIFIFYFSKCNNCKLSLLSVGLMVTNLAIEMCVNNLKCDVMLSQWKMTALKSRSSFSIFIFIESFFCNADFKNFTHITHIRF